MEIRLDVVGRRTQARQLQAIMVRLHEVADEGKILREVEDDLKRVALRLARLGYLQRRSPDGKGWRAGKSGGGDLIMSGAMLAALKVEDRESGFALVDRVGAVGGQLYGGSHQYGRTIKARGVVNLRRESGRAIRNAYAFMEGAKPLRWQTTDGRWHSAWKVRVPARPFLPRKGQLPPAWARDFERACGAIMRRHFTSSGANW